MRSSIASKATVATPDTTLLLTRVSEKAEAAARQVFAAHTLADCLRMRRQQPPVFHGIFHPVPAKSRGV